MKYTKVIFCYGFAAGYSKMPERPLDGTTVLLVGVYDVIGRTMAYAYTHSQSGANTFGVFEMKKVSL